MQGGRRLVIPPGLACGDCGAGHAIATGETLIFVCGLVWAWAFTARHRPEMPLAGAVRSL
jgi:hypothetical protein